VEIEREIGPRHGVEDGGGDPLGGRPGLVSGERPVELRVVDRVPVLADEKAVVVGDADDQQFPGELLGVELRDEPADDAEPVEFVAVGDRLHEQRLAVAAAVYDRNR